METTPQTQTSIDAFCTSASGQYRKSTGSNKAAKLPAEEQHLRLNDLRKFRCSRKIYQPSPGTKHRTVRSPFK